MSTRKKTSLWWLALPFAVVLALMLALTLPNGLAADAYSLARVAGLLGYLLIFVAVLSSAFVRPLIKTFGRPFVLLHHIVSYSGLGIIFLHPILIAIAYGDRTILLPRFDSLGNFFRYGGSPAFDLLLAVLGAAIAQTPQERLADRARMTYVALIWARCTHQHRRHRRAAAAIKWSAWLLPWARRRSLRYAHGVRPNPPASPRQASRLSWASRTIGEAHASRMPALQV